MFKFEFMNRIYWCFFTMALMVSCASVYDMNAVELYQQNLKQEWENPKTTPLQEDEKANFKGITFFPVNKKYAVQADFTKIENGQTIPFPTSAKKIKHYKAYGKLHFELDGKELELTVYQSDPPIEGYETSLFLPFTDETNGQSTYGGGRYLDLEISDIKNDKLRIDFNKAYNPYCAYSKYYNCPIPPAENHMETEINAGVSYLE